MCACVCALYADVRCLDGVDGCVAAAFCCLTMGEYMLCVCVCMLALLRPRVGDLLVIVSKVESEDFGCLLVLSASVWCLCVCAVSDGQRDRERAKEKGVKHSHKSTHPPPLPPASHIPKKNHTHATKSQHNAHLPAHKTQLSRVQPPHEDRSAVCAPTRATRA